MVFNLRPQVLLDRTAKVKSLLSELHSKALGRRVNCRTSMMKIKLVQWMTCLALLPAFCESSTAQTKRKHEEKTSNEATNGLGDRKFWLKEWIRLHVQLCGVWHIIICGSICPLQFRYARIIPKSAKRYSCERVV